jgi:hypothetical protein
MAILADAAAPVPAAGPGSVAWSTALAAPMIWDGAAWRTFAFFVEAPPATPDWVPAGALLVADFENGSYWRSDLGVCTLDDITPNLSGGLIAGVGLTTGDASVATGFSGSLSDGAYALLASGFAVLMDYSAVLIDGIPPAGGDWVYPIVLWRSVDYSQELDFVPYINNGSGAQVIRAAAFNWTGPGTWGHSDSVVGGAFDRAAANFDPEAGEVLLSYQGGALPGFAEGSLVADDLSIIELAAVVSMATPGSYTGNATVKRVACFPQKSQAELNDLTSAPPPTGFSLDFSTGTLPSAATLTRASSGTRFNSAGTLVTEASDVARFDYDPASHVAKGLLVEPAATNLLLRSTEAGNAAWSRFQATVSADAVVGPDGTTTADLITPDVSGFAACYIQQQVASATGLHTFSRYVKAKSWTWICMSIYDGAHHRVWFNLAAGTVGTQEAGITGTISRAGGGWYRCSVTRASTGANPYGTLFLCDADNAGNEVTASATNGVYLWGAQFETNSATTAIATAGATASRAKDEITVTVPAGYSSLQVTYDDDSTSLVPCVAGANLYDSNDFARFWIKSLAGVA